MAGVAQGGCAKRDASSDPSRSRYYRRNWAVGRNSIGCAGVRRGVAPRRCEQCLRPGARPYGFRTQPERRSDTDGQRVRRHSSRSDDRARHRLPAVYYERYFAAAGGLTSYGSDTAQAFRLAAGYVDRILKGEKPADLPVQAPTKYDLVINLKIAKALGLEMPPTVLTRADEVIE